MIKKLRVKFIALAMASLVSVLAVIIGSVSALNYRSIINDADSILSVLAENGGVFPPMGGPGEPFGMRKKEFSPELPFESRFFSVRLDAEGRVLDADLGRIAAVDANTAAKYAHDVWVRGDEKGFVGNYRFILLSTYDGCQVIFLDCGRSLDSFRGFLLTSCLISLLGLLAVFALLAAFSGRIIRPVSESYEKQKRFITDAGHEIKTPLTIIDADAELLGIEHGDSKWLRDIKEQTERLTALTDSLISLSRLDENQARLAMIELPFSELVEEAVQSFRSPARLQGKTLESRIRPMLSVRGEQKSLRSLLTILLDNALKYSNDGGAVELSLDSNGKAVILEISNTTAEPVTAERLERMFDRFYRGDESRSSRVGGYGLGLSIAEGVVSAHKGKISASAPDPHTMKVTVTLPA